MPTTPRYPKLRGEDPPLPRCMTCGRACGEPGDFLALMAGAILFDDATRETGGPDDRMEAFLTLIKHSAEPDGPYTRLEIVEDLIGGQAEMLFCTAACLRSFLNAAVDELERRSDADRDASGKEGPEKRDITD